MRTLIAILLAILLSAASLGQAAAPVLVTGNGEGGQEHLPLVKVDVDARILGTLAETKMTLVFSNPEDVPREADFYFPLPDGAAVCGYALDINGKMVDACTVEATRAAQIYASAGPVQINPALMELARGNLFRARVFPIPAKGTRTVAIRYVTDLIAGGGVPEYRLPLAFKDKLDEFHVRIDVVAAEAAPQVLKSPVAGLTFVRNATGGFVAEKTLAARAIAEPLVIALPEKQPRPVTVERAADGKIYFCIRCDPPAAPAATPKRITVLWDGSGSRAEVNHKKELDALAALLAALKGPVTVDLVVFRNVAEPARQFKIEGSRAEPLLRTIAAIDYDGGTRLTSLTPAAGSPPPDLYLLFSDGMATLGNERPDPAQEEAAWANGRPGGSGWAGLEQLGALDAPVIVFAAGKDRNDGVLRNIVMKTGGALIDMDRPVAGEVAAEVGRAWQRIAAPVALRGKVTDLCPSQARFVSGGAVVVGRLEGDEAVIKVALGRAAGSMVEKTFTVSAKDAAAGNLLRFVWAANKAVDLQTEAAPDLKKIISLGKAYGVVTPYTSMIVMENLNQYLAYGIRPPDNLPELQKEYDAEMAPAAADQPPAGRHSSVSGLFVGPVEPPENLKTPRDPTRDALYNVLIPWYYRIALWDDQPEYPPDFKYKPTGSAAVAPGGAGGPLRQVYDGGIEAGSTPGREFTSRLIVVCEGAVGGVFGGGVAGGSGGEAPMFIIPGEGASTLVAPADGTPAPAVTAPAVAPSASSAAGTGTTIAPAAPPQDADDASPAGGPVVVTPADIADKSYRKKLADAPPDKLWSVYMAERPRHRYTPAFFADCALIFFDRGQEARAMQVLSNLAEFDDLRSAREVALRLEKRGRIDLAIQALAMVSDLEPDDPLTFYDRAAALERQGKLVEAAALYYKVSTCDFAFNSQGIQITALADLNRLIPRIGPEALKRLGVNRRLIKRMDADLRVVITWDQGVDVDLSVTEPSGEKCFYNHAATTIGGFLWSDVMDAGGPEEYTLRRAMPGRYKIDVSLAEPGMRVGLYGLASQPPEGPVLVRVEVFTDFSRAGEKHESFMVELKKAGEVLTVKELTLPPGPAVAAPPENR